LPESVRVQIEQGDIEDSRAVSEFARDMMGPTEDENNQAFIRELLIRRPDSFQVDLGYFLGNYLANRLSLNYSWDEFDKGRGAVGKERMQQEFKKYLQDFHSTDETPGMSLSEVQKRVDGYEAEVARLASEKQDLIQRSKDLYDKIHSDSKRKRKNPTLVAAYESLEKMLGRDRGGRYFANTGLLADYDKRIHFNKDQLSEHKTILRDVRLVEALVKELKPRMGSDEVGDMWMEVISRFKHSLQPALFEVLVQWLEEQEGFKAEEPLSDSVSREKKEKRLKLLLERFREVKGYIEKDNQPDSQSANVFHAQLILRKLLKNLAT